MATYRRTSYANQPDKESPEAAESTARGGVGSKAAGVGLKGEGKGTAPRRVGAVARSPGMRSHAGRGPGQTPRADSLPVRVPHAKAGTRVVKGRGDNMRTVSASTRGRSARPLCGVGLRPDDL